MLEALELFLEKLNFFVVEENKRLTSAGEAVTDRSLEEKRALAEELDDWVRTLRGQPGLADQKRSGVFLEKLQKLLMVNLENQKHLERVVPSAPGHSSLVAPRALRVYGS